ncbi:S8 family serine peptidase [Streptomyces sp. ME02-7008A-1]|uniref:cyanobactin maturation protease PatG family protein n=1 Tax=unclassified Streptomyces TaxID=2593676 RepID=UPI0029BA2965|nr:MULTISPECIES: S8 family serine peptidase [unclassified Streptomyces]MDX3186218.1 S8 family serine peptidase [Streptomyces sp. ME02-7008A-1]MDX3307333.1 S8 family serine peptidase [Streptomyces sp. ME02-7008A]
MYVRSSLQGVSSAYDLLGDPRVCVAVLDGPVNTAHPCFEGADLTRLDTLVQDPAGHGPMSLHGTHVTSLIFGQPGSPVVGLAPRSRGLLLPVFRDSLEGTVAQLDLVRAIERAVEEGAHIINISGGEWAPDGSPDSLLERALHLCEDRGVLVVSAVGNDGCDCLQVPAAVPSVLAVGATGNDGRPMELNNWGGAYQTNGLLAPGQDIDGAVPGGRQKLTGSSFATPVVSGVAALLVAAQLDLGREAEPLEARAALLETASAPPCSPSDAPECRRRLAGHLNAAGAYDLITRDQASVTDLDTAQLPPSPGGRNVLQATEVPSGPGASAAGEPSSLVPPISDSNEEADTMDNQPIAPNAQGEHRVEPSGSAPDAAFVSAPPPVQQTRPDQPQDQTTESAEVLRAAGEAPLLETEAQSPANEGDHDMANQPPDATGETGVPEVPQAAVAQAGSEPSASGRSRSDGVRASCPGESPGTGCECGGAPEQSCGCGGQRGRRQLVYAIGTIGFDYLTEACRDVFRAQMPAVTVPASGGMPERELPPNPYDPVQLADFLSSKPWLADKVTWLLQMDSTAVYALKPEEPVGMDWSRPLVAPSTPSEQEGNADEAHTEVSQQDQLKYLLDALSQPPGSTIHKAFRDALKGQSVKPLETGHISRVSVPGELTGRTVRLYNGQTVAEVKVATPGVHTWNETVLVNSVVKAVREAEEASTQNQVADERAVKARIGMSDAELRTITRTFLDSIYNQFRNLGQTSADRALNFAGTNAFAFSNTIKDGLLSGRMVPGPAEEGRQHMYALESIRVSKSPYCRPGSDCQDVTVTFFDPENDRRAKTVYQFTYDVSYHLPVSLAPIHTFLER